MNRESIIKAQANLAEILGIDSEARAQMHVSDSGSAAGKRGAHISGLKIGGFEEKKPELKQILAQAIGCDATIEMMGSKLTGIILDGATVDDPVNSLSGLSRDRLDEAKTAVLNLKKRQLAQR